MVEGRSKGASTVLGLGDTHRGLWCGNTHTHTDTHTLTHTHTSTPTPVVLGLKAHAYTLVAGPRGKFLMGLKVEIGAGDKTRLFNEFCSKTRPGRVHIQETGVRSPIQAHRFF